jgi:hypothetical protein
MTGIIETCLSWKIEIVEVSFVLLVGLLFAISLSGFCGVFGDSNARFY